MPVNLLCMDDFGNGDGPCLLGTVRKPNQVDVWVSRSLSILYPTCQTVNNRVMFRRFAS
jgi:hypothetical protein